MGKIICKILGTIWAFPVTLIGLALVLISGPSGWAISEGAIDVSVRRFPFSFGFPIAARTFGQVIAYRPSARANVRLRAHERRHVLQCEVLGPLVLLAYPLGALVGLASGGSAYLDNPLETDAREAEK